MNIHIFYIKCKSGTELRVKHTEQKKLPKVFIHIQDNIQNTQIKTLTLWHIKLKNKVYLTLKQCMWNLFVFTTISSLDCTQGKEKEGR